MSKPRKRAWDIELTKQLNQPELFVEKGSGDHEHYRTWLVDPSIDVCPHCGGSKIKVHSLCSKSYKDLLDSLEDLPVISFDFYFYKWRCLNPNCKHIFSKDINFAAKHNNHTYRLEDALVFYVNKGNSYEMTSSILYDSITRQAVGQIYNRWVTCLDGQREMPHPIRHLAIRSGKTSKDRYTIFLNLDNGIKVIDILYRVKTTDIVKLLSKLDCSSVELVISDCDPTIVAVIKAYFPNTEHVIPVDFWFDLVSSEFKNLAHEVLRWYPLPDKMTLIMTPTEELYEKRENLEKLLKIRPSIVQPYADINRLRKIIKQSDKLWTYDELLAWLESTDECFQNNLSMARYYLEHCRSEIEAYSHYHRVIPNQLFEYLARLDDLLCIQRIFSTAMLKGRVLYYDRACCNNTDLNSWTGIEIETVLSRMEGISRFLLEEKALDEDFELADLSNYQDPY